MDKNIKDFINGLFAGWTQVIIMQPFDRLKVMLQNHEATGISDGIKKVIR